MSVRALGHLVAAVHFWFGCYYDWFYVEVPSDIHRMGSSFGKSKKLKFLTYWDAVIIIFQFIIIIKILIIIFFLFQLLQALFFTICVVNDLIGSNENEPKKVPLIRKIKDVVRNKNYFYFWR